MRGSIYSPIRLQKAIGNIAGTQLGFDPNPEGGVKPLPETSAEIVKIKKIYPPRRCVDFCFLGSDTIHSAVALLDHWYREGMDDIQPPQGMNGESNNLSWPFTLPESNNIDLLTQISLLSLIYPPFKSLVPVIQQLVDIMGGQHNVIKLLQILASNNSLNLSMLFQLIGLKAPSLDDLKNPEKLKDLIQLRDVPDLSKIKDLTSVPKTETPKEPLYGAVIPVKGDKRQGYLLLGFLKLI